MKKISAIALLLFSIIASAQNEIAEDTTAKPAITAIGKADGQKAEMKIGKPGGRFTSSDRKVELIIPEGAVSKKTTFSILPITNMVPNGNGKAYRLEPSGVQFQKPVQLIFHYTEEESVDSMQLLMGIATQDNTGQWYCLKNFTLDTIKKTVSGHINHFSDWSKFDAIKLDPGHKRVKILNSLTLQILGVVPRPKESDDEELSPLYRTKEPKQLIWKVNEVVGGNANFGTIKGWAGSAADRKLEYGNFIAPAAVPDKQNPVAVTVNLKGLNYKFNNIVFKDLKLVSNLLIYDNAYEIKMISVVNGIAGSVLGACKYKDTGSFVVSLNGKESKIIEKVNKNAAAELDYDGKCTIVPLKPGSGNIHIAGSPVIKITPSSSPNGPATIEITFSRYPTIFPLLNFTCPDGNGGTFTSSNAKANAFVAGLLPAAPQYIKFEAKYGEQTQVVGKEGGDIYFKYIIKRLEED
jgi:hypothetical protein